MFRRILLSMIIVAVMCAPLAAQVGDDARPMPGCNRFDAPAPPCLAQVDDPDTFMHENRRYGQGRKRNFEAQDRQRQHLEQLRMLKLLELLDLDEDQELNFLTSFRAMRRENSELQDKKVELMEELVEALNADKIDDGRVNRTVEDILKLEKERGRVMDNFIGEVRGFLNPEQLGKLIIFQEKFEVQLLEKIKNFQSRKGRNP